MFKRGLWLFLPIALACIFLVIFSVKNIRAATVNAGNLNQTSLNTSNNSTSSTSTVNSRCFTRSLNVRICAGTDKGVIVSSNNSTAPITIPKDANTLNVQLHIPINNNYQILVLKSFNQDFSSLGETGHFGNSTIVAYNMGKVLYIANKGKTCDSNDFGGTKQSSWVTDSCNTSNNYMDWVGHVDLTQLTYSDYSKTEFEFDLLQANPLVGLDPLIYADRVAPKCPASNDLYYFDGNVKPIAFCLTNIQGLLDFYSQPKVTSSQIVTTFDCAGSTVNPATDAVLGQPVAIDIHNALNVDPTYASSHNPLIEGVTYRLKLEANQSGYQSYTCKTQDCTFDYTLPSENDIDPSIPSANIIIEGPYGSNGDYLQELGGNLTDPNNSNSCPLPHIALPKTKNQPVKIVAVPLTLDRAWGFILQNDPGQIKQQNCTYENPPETCPVDPNSSSDKYKAAPSAMKSPNTVIACHGPKALDSSFSEFNEWVCADNTNVACNVNPNNIPTPGDQTIISQNNVPDGAILTNNIRCIPRYDLKLSSPCAVSSAPGDSNNPQTCLRTRTGIGDFPTTTNELIASLFGILLTLAGAVSLLLIISSGYRIMTSQGNPEALQAGRDQLTSAVVGLLFIIFSLIIFEIITHTILHIPGIL